MKQLHLISISSRHSGAARRLAFCGLFFCFAVASKAQGWIQTFGDFLELRSIVTTKDGGCILAGSTPYFGDVCLIRTDPEGRIVWQRQYGGTQQDWAEQIVANGDGYALIGSTYNVAGPPGILLMKINEFGDLLWEQSFDVSSNDYGVAVTTSPDGGILALGDRDYSYPWLIKTGAEGALEWSLPNWISCDDIHSMETTPDGGLLIGCTDYFTSGNYQFKMVKTTQNGTVLWEKFYGTPHDDHLFAGATQLSDGSLLGAGIAVFGANWDSTDLLLVKTDASGNPEWQHQISTPYLDQITAIVPLDSDHFVIAGGAYFYDNNPFEAKLCEVNSQGEETWAKYFYGKAFTDAKKANDGGLFLLARSNNFPSDRSFLMKTDAFGNVFSNFIAGTVARDLPADCLPDSLDAPLKNWMVKAEGAQTAFTLSDENGGFSLNVDTGNYVVSVQPPNGLWQPCSASLPVLMSEPFDTFHLDFQIETPYDCPYMELDVSTTLLRRCFQNTYHVKYCNTGTALAENAKVRLYLDDFLGMMSASLPFTFEAGSYTFPVGNVVPGECGEFTFTAELSCEATLGQEHCVEAILQPVFDCVPDSLLSDRLYHATDCRSNVGSFDPNDKSAFPSGVGEERLILADSAIWYHIRFQNTGTDTAFRVVIRDTLPPWFDLSDLKLGASSHPYQLEIIGEGMLKFIFENIMLPDSNINEPGSHGFVKFRLRPLHDVPLGTPIENRAAIFFDFNDPVLTNTVLRVLTDEFPTGTSDRPDQSLRVSVFPNPVAGEGFSVELEFVREMNAEAALFDVWGRKLMPLGKPGFFAPGKYLFPVSSAELPAGAYLLVIQSDIAMLARKIIRL